MKYQLLYTKRSVKDIKKLDRVIQKWLKKALEKLRENPLRYAKKLMDQKLGGYRFRVGNYRIIFDFEGSKIIILRVGHRKEIYR